MSWCCCFQCHGFKLALVQLSHDIAGRRHLAKSDVSSPYGALLYMQPQERVNITAIADEVPGGRYLTVGVETKEFKNST